MAKKSAPKRRKVLLNDVDGNAANKKQYCNNMVTTSKYTILTFLPINLFEQFQRIANGYFLLIALLQQIPGVSPLGTGTTAMTLAVVLTATAIKDGFEDYKRHRSDKVMNAKRAKVLRGASHDLLEVASKDIQVGDIVRIEDGQYFMADMVLLSTSENASIAYIETKNLDGETNLKERIALKDTRTVMDDAAKLMALKGFVECEGPNNRLSSFDGTLNLGGGDPAPIEPKNILLTGCQLKYTAWAYGFVVYTGKQSKLQMQTAGEKLVKKTSDVERKTNKLIIIIFFAQIALVICSAVGAGVWLQLRRGVTHYLALESKVPATQGLLAVLTFIILFSNLIPISLYVSMETVKVAQAELINADLNMYYAADDIPAKARTSSLNEELGQIEYIFSDKTGTLTCNNLVFVKCSVGGAAYGRETDDFPRHDGVPNAAFAVLDQAPIISMPSGRMETDAPVLDDAVGLGGTSLSSLAGATVSNGAGVGPIKPKSGAHGGKVGVAPAESAPPRPSASGGAGGAGGAGVGDYSYEYSYTEQEESAEEQMEHGRAGRRAGPEGGVRSNAPHGEVFRVPHNDDGAYAYTYSESFYTYTYSEEDAAVAPAPRPSAAGAGSSGGARAMPALVPAPRARTAAAGAGAARTPMGGNPGESAFMRGASVANVQFGDGGGRMKSVVEAGGADAADIEAFFLSMALNHTVIPRADADSSIGVAYQAGSPDEGALVNTGAYFGYVFHSRTPDTYTVSVNGVDRVYEMLAFCFFDNDRKRMSVVVREPEGRVVAYVKGADTSMLPYLDKSEEGYEARRHATDQHLSLFALKGLRTLVFASKVMSEAEYQSFAAMYQAANAMPSGTKDSPQSKAKKEALERAYFHLEAEHKDLHLLGASAIEDRLQDGVPDTIATLRKAGIKIWVLTGDKQDTAIQIGYSCNLLEQGKPIIVLNDVGDTPEVVAATKLPKDATDEAKTAARLAAVQRAQERMITVLEREVKAMDEVLAREPGFEFQCAVDGLTLEALLGDTGAATRTELCQRTTTLLLNITARCKAVIGCRVSPAQKAQVVAMVKRGVTPTPITLAVGDGANDVVMIKEAHVGVGISGREGQQASLAADYAIGQFRYLEPLLLTHGYWCYNRIATLILYSFTKNVAIALVPWFYTFSNAFSGTTPIEAWSQALYNVTFTALPILMVGIYDQVVPRHKIKAFPQLYLGGIRKRFFNIPTFARWMLSGIYYAVISYFFVVFGVLALAVYKDNGQVFGLYEQGTVIYTVLFLVVTGKLALETASWTVVNSSMMLFSIAVFFAWMILYSYVGTVYSPSMNYYGTGVAVLNSPLFWLATAVSVVVGLVPDVLWKYIRRMMWPTPLDIVMETPVAAGKPMELATFEKTVGAGVALAQSVGGAGIVRSFNFEPAPGSFQHVVQHAPASGKNFPKYKASPAP